MLALLRTLLLLLLALLLALLVTLLLLLVLLLHQELLLVLLQLGKNSRCKLICVHNHQAMHGRCCRLLRDGCIGVGLAHKLAMLCVQCNVS